MRILHISNDEQLDKNLIGCLKKLSYQVDTAENFKDGEYYISIRNYDVVITKWKLSDGYGNDIIGYIKEKSPKTTILILSDTQDKEAEVKSLNLGADDFMTKDVDFDVLIARMEARLRFSTTGIIQIKSLVINPDEEKITHDGKEIELKGKPFEVLTHLARHKDQIVSKEQLLDAIWEEPELVTPNVIEVAINQIRQKMDKPLNITTVETVRRRGYRFCYNNKK